MISEIEHLIISKLHDLIDKRKLGAGDKLPAELSLSEQFGVSRRNVRTVISKLESYELVKTFPQSGTMIGNIRHVALLGILENLLELKKDDFKSLLETRIFLEVSTAKLAAERCSKEDLKQIEEKFLNYKEKTLRGEDATQEDVLFHLAIAKACGNPTLNALMLQITPKLVTVFEYNRVINRDRYDLGEESFKNYESEIAKEVEIHAAIYNAIKDKKPLLAVKCMENHFAVMLNEII